MQVGCPIRTPADQFLLADPRSFSQLTTSFFADESLGIPHTPLFTSSSYSRMTLLSTLSYHHLVKELLLEPAPAIETSFPSLILCFYLWRITDSNR
jgi:hypothetical protein